MRFALLLALASLACAADPVLLPDAGPCSSACGAGTVCQSGACVAVDGGELSDAACPFPDAQVPCMCGSVVGFRVCQVDRTYTTCLCSFPPPDAGADAGSAMDVPGTDAAEDRPAADVPPDTYGACVANGIRTCDGRNVDIQGGERDGGPGSVRVYHCGGCGITCAAGEVCDLCRCGR